MSHESKEGFRPSEKEYWDNIDVNDCGYLLRTLERESFTSIVNTLRAKGPPSEYTFILLEHLKSALCINDELGRSEIRRAANDPKLAKIAAVLNPSYDTDVEWLTNALDARGDVEAGPSRGKPFARTSSNSIADQLRAQAAAHNESIAHSIGRSVELLAIPPTPFVPERLRLLLRETDRPEQRIPLPLEAPPAPTPTSLPSSKGDRSHSGPPPTKKRKPRVSKAAAAKEKEKEKPPQLKAEKSPRQAVGMAEFPLGAISAAAAAANPPTTPLAISAAAAAVASVVNSSGSAIISPGQPPQSGEAMKTWVSKMHEQEQAAVKKNGAGAGAAAASVPMTNPLMDLSFPSTSSAASAASAEDSAKSKKTRRPRAPAQDPLYLNSSARTRPFQFEAAVNGGTKPPRGNPDKSDYRTTTASKRVSPSSYGGSFTAAVMSGANLTASSMAAAAAAAAPVAFMQPDMRITTPLSRHAHVHAGEVLLAYGTSRDREDPAILAPGSTVAGNMNSIERAAGGAASGAPAAAALLSASSAPSTSSGVKRVYNNISSRAQGSKYFVNSAGGAVPSPQGSGGITRTNTAAAGMGGRTASLGNHQLSALHGFSSGLHFTAHKPSTSAIPIGSMPAGVHSSPLMAEPAQPVSALPPEEYGHDYRATMSAPGTNVLMSAAHSAATAAMSAGPSYGVTSRGGGGGGEARDATGGLRLAPRVISRPRLTNPILRSPVVVQQQQQQQHQSTHSPQNHAAVLAAASNGLSLLSSSPHGAASSSMQLQQRGGASGSSLIRPRTLSRGTSAASLALLNKLPMTDKNLGDPVTDERVQATVHTIMLEAAQKECANGKRSFLPRDLVEKNPGTANRPSSSASCSSSSGQPAKVPSSPQSTATCRATITLPPPASLPPPSGTVDAAAAAAPPAAVSAPPPPPPAPVSSVSYMSTPSQQLLSSALGSGMIGRQPLSSSPLLSSTQPTPPVPLSISSPLSAMFSSAFDAAAAVTSASAVSGISGSPLSLLGGSLFATGVSSSSPLFGTGVSSSPPLFGTGVLSSSPLPQSPLPLPPTTSSFSSIPPLLDPAFEELKQMLMASLQQGTLSSPMGAPHHSPVDAAAAAGPSSSSGGDGRTPSAGPRQYRLDPASSSYTDIDMNNPMSYKSFASDGTPVQYMVTPEELYDHGALPRPSTSAGGGGGGGMRRTDQQAQPSPLSLGGSSLLAAAAAATAAAQLGVPSSFSIPSTTAFDATNRGVGIEPSVSSGSGQETQPAAPAAAIEGEERAAADERAPEGLDILEQSCMELR